MKKAKINYPCFWEYKVIGADKKLLEKAAAQVIINRDYKVNLSARSKSGKYTCLNIETRVYSEADRNSIFSGLQNHSQVKIVF